MKMGDLVKIYDSWNSRNPPIIGIFIDLESLEDKQRGRRRNPATNPATVAGFQSPRGHISHPRIKVLLPSGQITWRFSFELEKLR